MKLTYQNLIKILNESEFFKKVSLNYSYEDFSDLTYKVDQYEEETNWIDLKSDKHILRYKYSKNEMNSWEKLSFELSNQSYTRLLGYLKEIFKENKWTDKLNAESKDLDKIKSFLVIIDGLNVLYSEAKGDIWLVEISRYK